MLSAGLAACSSTPTSDDASPDAPGDAPGASQAAQVEPVRLTTSFTDARSVPIDAPVTVSADGGDLSDVRVTSAAGPVEGRVEGGTWTSTSLLEPGTDYRISASATRSDGEAVERTRAFHTVDLTLDQQTYPSIAPLDGETVGVGMPVVVTFDVPVTDRALFEKHMNVTSTPAQKGSWYWLSDSEAHFRPARYWKAGTDVSVDLDLNSLPAGNGIYGQEDRQLSFHVGDAHVYKVNAQTHQMQVFSNGELLRTLPITTGKPGFTTRSGVKVIMEKFETPPDELRDGRHQPQQPRGLRHRRRALGDAGHLLGRVHPRRTVVGRLPGLRQRVPRLHGPVDRRRRLALRHDPAWRRRGVHRHRPSDDPRERLRRLEPRPCRLEAGLRAQLTRALRRRPYGTGNGRCKPFPGT